MLNIKNIKKDISSGAIFRKISRFFGENIKILVFTLFFLLSGFCVYIWYSCVYDYEWSEEKKADYLKTKDQDVTFNRKKFQEIVEKEKKRAEEYGKTLEIKNDIFGIK